MGETHMIKKQKKKETAGAWKISFNYKETQRSTLSASIATYN